MQEKEIKELERIVTMYLDFAELQAERQIPMKMADWVTRLYRVYFQYSPIFASLDYTIFKPYRHLPL